MKSSIESEHAESATMLGPELAPVPTVMAEPHDLLKPRLQQDPALQRGPLPGRGARPRAAGKFVFVGDRKLLIRGVTYGTFSPRPGGDDYPPEAVLEQDFALMAASGINSVRCYTPPQRRVLDAALRHGLWVMVGLPWEQHVTFLDDPTVSEDIVRRVRDSVRTCAGHEAVLCFAVGNEIPASIVRWHGARRIERFIHRLYREVKSEDPMALVTYVNYPTTEYLRLPFLDLQCFNVYLESQDRLEGYLARLQNLAAERPLLIAEIGLDSRRNGQHKQAESLEWQIRTAFAEGCAGAIAFAWTDEWHRGGFEITDWDFGLVTRRRTPKPALAAVARAYRETPFPSYIQWPRITVALCVYNGARTIRDALVGISKLEYPNFETIVVNDGSTDATPQIAGEYDVRLISTENFGLSAARNTAWQHATGDIVAYIDDDAYPDAHWLHFLAYRFMTGDWVGVGGPNIPPADDGLIAECVANAPGGPVHVLISDLEAEHIPGCNMAFRVDALEAIGGFDPRFRTAGDDVDICWRLQEAGGRIGFHAGAMDWHHRRRSVGAYWRQQKGYGKAEALLEAKWPDRYNRNGHISWRGSLYGKGIPIPISFRRVRVYGGVWGTAAYQSLYAPKPSSWLTFPLMPEWYLAVVALLFLSLLGLSWQPLLWLLPVLALAASAPVVQASLAANRAQHLRYETAAIVKVKAWAMTFALHLLQPVARLHGRLKHGLTPWRNVSLDSLMQPAPTGFQIWSERWLPPQDWIRRTIRGLSEHGMRLQLGSGFDSWDFEVHDAVTTSIRAQLVVEEHGAGRQLVRCRLSISDHKWLAVSLLALAVGILGLYDRGWGGAIALIGIATIGLAIFVADCRRLRARLITVAENALREGDRSTQLEAAYPEERIGRRGRERPGEHPIQRQFPAL